MAHKVMIIVKGSEIKRVKVAADAPRPITKWLRNCAKAALMLRTAHFILKHGGAWHAHHCYGSTAAPRWTDPIRTFPNEDAAAMWLLIRRAD